MIARTRRTWRSMLDSFWFRPASIVVLFVALSFGFVAIDGLIAGELPGIAFSGGAPAARTILSTIAGSLITVAGLALSLTIVTLQLVSGQYTPRALRSFVRDTFNQSAAGVFVGIFVYCLLVLREVRDETPLSPRVVPALSVSLAIALAVLGLGLLLVYVHSIARSIQVSNITAKIAGETVAAIHRLYPSEIGEQTGTRDGGPVIKAWRAAPSVGVRPRRNGYVAAVDVSGVAQSTKDARIALHVAPGDFVTEDTVVAEVWGTDDPGALGRRVRGGIIVENERTMHQDARYGIRQLADIALRAVSPGINDPTTAVTCVGYLRACLELLARRAWPDAVREFDERDVRLVARVPSFGDHLMEAFDELGREASDQPNVVRAIMEGLAGVAGVASQHHANDRAAAAVGLARRISALVESRAETPEDRELIVRRREQVELAGRVAS